VTKEEASSMPADPLSCTGPPAAVTPLPIRIGVDLARIEDVAASLGRYGLRYARKVYTDAEIAETEGGAQAASLAARFAAKEATIKALQPTDEPPPWRSIEVRRVHGGACRLVLHDRAHELAAEAGLDSWSLSMCHEGPVAVAVVAATGPGARFRNPSTSPLQETNDDG
jgi:holo-[acyl-carrier protein] synthase